VETAATWLPFWHLSLFDFVFPLWLAFVCCVVALFLFGCTLGYPMDCGGGRDRAGVNEQRKERKWHRVSSSARVAKGAKKASPERFEHSRAEHNR
jgi:hypothetical protein